MCSTRPGFLWCKTFYGNEEGIFFKNSTTTQRACVYRESQNCKRIHMRWEVSHSPRHLLMAGQNIINRKTLFFLVLFALLVLWPPLVVWPGLVSQGVSLASFGLRSLWKWQVRLLPRMPWRLEGEATLPHNMDVEVMQPVIENVLRQLFQRAELFWVRGFFDVKVLLPIPVCVYFVLTIFRIVCVANKEYLNIWSLLCNGAYSLRSKRDSKVTVNSPEIFFCLIIPA